MNKVAMKGGGIHDFFEKIRIREKKKYMRMIQRLEWGGMSPRGRIPCTP